MSLIQQTNFKAVFNNLIAAKEAKGNIIDIGKLIDQLTDLVGFTSDELANADRFKVNKELFKEVVMYWTYMAMNRIGYVTIVRGYGLFVHPKRVTREEIAGYLIKNKLMSESQAKASTERLFKDIKESFPNQFAIDLETMECYMEETVDELIKALREEAV